MTETTSVQEAPALIFVLLLLLFTMFLTGFAAYCQLMTKSGFILTLIFFNLFYCQTMFDAAGQNKQAILCHRSVSSEATLFKAATTS